MARYRIKLNDSPPLTAGPEHDDEGFSINVRDKECGENDPNCNSSGPRLRVASGRVDETNGTSIKFWADDHVPPGSVIQIEVVEDGSIDGPIRIDSHPHIKHFCILCRKTSDEVEYLIEPPGKAVCLCDNCIRWLSEQLKSQATGTA